MFCFIQLQLKSFLRLITFDLGTSLLPSLQPFLFLLFLLFLAGKPTCHRGGWKDQRAIFPASLAASGNHVTCVGQGDLRRCLLGALGLLGKIFLLAKNIGVDKEEGKEEEEEKVEREREMCVKGGREGEWEERERNAWLLSFPQILV